MKKRILAFVCAAVMVMGMSLTATAAGSITADDVKEEVASSAQEEATKDAPANTTVSVTTEKIEASVQGSALKVEIPVSVEQREASVSTAQSALATKDETIKINPIQANQLASVAKIATKIANEAPKQAIGGRVISKVETKFVVDLSVTDGAAKTFTFNVVVEDNQKAYAYHYTASGVEVIPCTKSAAGVSFKLDSYSPVALVVVTEVDEQTPVQTTTETPAVTTESPKTGDVVTLFAMVSAVAGAGALALKKREN